MSEIAEKLLREIEEAERHYGVIQDFRKGADYPLNTLREHMIGFKESLSKVRIWVAGWIKAVYGRDLELPIGDLPDKLNFCVFLIEADPQIAPSGIRALLLVGQTKIEDVMAIVDAIKTMIMSERRRGESREQ